MAGFPFHTVQIFIIKHTTIMEIPKTYSDKLTIVIPLKKHVVSQWKLLLKYLESILIK